jgi:hypothetical protein
MSREVTTSWISAIDIAGSEIKSTYTSTSLGTERAGFVATPELAVAGSVAVAGAITTLTVRLVGVFNGLDVPLLSHKIGSTSADATEWTFTTAEDVAFTTVEHIGADAVRVDVKGNIEGTSGDAADLSMRGCVN